MAVKLGDLLELVVIYMEADSTIQLVQANWVDDRYLQTGCLRMRCEWVQREFVE